jgi:hypothetical protein
LTTGKTIMSFPSQRAAARATGTYQGGISKCLREPFRSAGGFGWRLAGSAGVGVGGDDRSDGDSSAMADEDEYEDDDEDDEYEDDEDDREEGEEEGEGEEDGSAPAHPHYRGSSSCGRSAAGPSMDVLRRLCGDERRVLEAVRACPAPGGERRGGSGSERGGARGVRAVELVMRLVPACDPSWRWYDLLHSELGELTALVDGVLYGAVQQGRLVVADGSAGDSDSDSDGDSDSDVDQSRRYVVPVDADVYQASGWDGLL